MPLRQSAANPYDPLDHWPHDRWGDRGRPILLLNDPGRDRSTWWPAAARLAEHHRVVVADLPDGPSPYQLVDDLGAATDQLGTLAPVLVGHRTAALIATLFGMRIHAHAIVAIEHRLDVGAAPGSAVGSDHHRLHNEILDGGASIKCPYLAVYSRKPWPGYAEWLREHIPVAHCEYYDISSPHPDPHDVARFVASIRALSH